MSPLNQMLLQGKEIPYQHIRVPVSQLKLDPRNPRLQYVVNQLDGHVTDKTLHDAIWEKDKVKQLAESIFHNGGVREPIYVVEHHDSGGGISYIVKEGNCRTVSCRHLQEKNPGDNRFMTLPAYVFKHDMSEEEWAVLLADFHVAGKTAWDKYEQARHVTELHKKHGKTYEWLSSHLRMPKSKISELLKSYEITTNYLDKYDDPKNVKKFSFFNEIVKRKDLREMWDTNAKFQEDVVRWVREEKLYDSKQVRDIPLILVNPEAKKELDEKGYEAAKAALYRANPALESDLYSAIEIAINMINNAPADEIQEIKDGKNPQKVIMLRNLSNALQNVATLAGVKL